MIWHKLRNLHLSPGADTDPAPAVAPPVAPPIVPASTPPVEPMVETDPIKGGNDEAKYRRLFEKSEADKKRSDDRLAVLDAAETARKQAEMSDIDRANAARDAAIKRADDMQHAVLIDSIATQYGLTAEAREFLTGTDAAALEASALKLAGLMKTPVRAGTTTQPASTPPIGMDERINSAIKAGKPVEAIRLMREKQGLTSSST